MKKVKMDINDLLEQCRSNGYFDIGDIEYAIMEANGELSILPKGEKLPVTIEDMKLKAKKQSLCANIIIDSKIMSKCLKDMKKTEEWLTKELKVKGYQDLDKILLVTLDNNDKLTIYEKNLGMDTYNILE